VTNALAYLQAASVTKKKVSKHCQCYYFFLRHWDCRQLSQNNYLAKPGNPYWRGWISTIDLLVVTSSDQLLLDCF